MEDGIAEPIVQESGESGPGITNFSDVCLSMGAIATHQRPGYQRRSGPHGALVSYQDENNPNLSTAKMIQERILGSGAFGQVFLYKTPSGKLYAVKEANTGGDHDEITKEVKALQQEIRLLQNLESHPRIIKYYGCECREQRLSIFMEFMPKGSLFALIKKERKAPLNTCTTKKYTKQILEGLKYLHSKSIIHRDLKCANILLNNSDNVKLADFGVSKQLQTLCSIAGAQTIAGTAHWMSPEVIKEEEYGTRSDIWSLGCTCVEMLTGNPPWHKSRFPHTKIASDKPPEYSLPNWRLDVNDFLKQCFCRNPSERPAARYLLSHRFLRVTDVIRIRNDDGVAEEVEHASSIREHHRYGRIDGTCPKYTRAPLGGQKAGTSSHDIHTVAAANRLTLLALQDALGERYAVQDANTGGDHGEIGPQASGTQADHTRWLPMRQRRQKGGLGRISPE